MCGGMCYLLHNMHTLPWRKALISSGLFTGLIIMYIGASETLMDLCLEQLSNTVAICTAFSYLLTPSTSHPLLHVNTDTCTTIKQGNLCYCRALKTSMNEGASDSRNARKQLLHPSAKEILTKLQTEARQYFHFLCRGYQRHRGLTMVVWGMIATIFNWGSPATVLSAQNIPRSW